VNLAKPPLTYKDAPWVERGSDLVSIDEFQRSLAVACLKAFGLCRQRARSSNRGVMPDRKMQTVGGFAFHGDAKRIAFNVTRGQGTKKNDRSGHSNDSDKNRNRCGANQQFPSQGSKVTKLYRYKVTKTFFVTLLTFKRSLGLACHSQLRKKKCVNVSQLFDALVQRSADAVTCTGARPQ
jgi:hypothetical protein